MWYKNYYIDEHVYIDWWNKSIPIFLSELYTQFRDIERCPYLPKDYQYKAWITDDDKRLLLTQLNRYADKLQRKVDP